MTLDGTDASKDIIARFPHIASFVRLFVDFLPLGWRFGSCYLRIAQRALVATIALD